MIMEGGERPISATPRWSRDTILFRWASLSHCSHGNEWDLWHLLLQVKCLAATTFVRKYFLLAYEKIVTSNQIF